MIDNERIQEIMNIYEMDYYNALLLHDVQQSTIKILDERMES